MSDALSKDEIDALWTEGTGALFKEAAAAASLSMTEGSAALSGEEGSALMAEADLLSR